MKINIKRLLKRIIVFGLVIFWGLLGLNLVVDTLKVKTNSYINYEYLDENAGLPVVLSGEGNKRFVYVKGEKLEINENYIEVPMSRKPGYYEGSLVIPVNYEIIIIRLIPFLLVALIILYLIISSKGKVLLLIPVSLMYIVFLVYVGSNVELGYINKRVVDWGILLIILLAFFSILLGLKSVFRNRYKYKQTDSTC